MKIVDTTIATIGIFLAISLTPHTAVSQERVFVCESDLGTALSVMEKRFGEFAFSTAVNEHNSFTAFTVDPEDRSWSMLLTMPNGHVCLVHFGERWEPVFPDPGEPS